MVVQLSLQFLEPDRAPETIRTTDPCKGCALAGLCGDECGMKLYPIDTPTTRFKNLEVFIQFLKHNGWR